MQSREIELAEIQAEGSDARPGRHLLVIPDYDKIEFASSLLRVWVKMSRFEE